MHRVLVYRRRFLPKSETFIYEQLLGHEQVKPIVLTRTKPMNRKQFPYHPVVVRKRFAGLSSWLKKNRIKCLHARFGPAGLELLPFARKNRLPLITSFHGFDATKQVRNQVYRKQLRSLFRKGDAFTVVSQHMKRKLVNLGCPERKITLIRSGIDLQKFPMLPIPSVADGKFRLLSVGRLTEKKGMDTLIRAFARVHAHYPDATLTIIGDGEQKSKLKRLIREKRLETVVKMRGALPHAEVRREMARCHLFVLACKTARDGNQEGIPNVLMEAMATGRPVVTTQHAGIPELVKHQETGYLVPERSPEKLARMVINVLAAPSSWQEVATRARAKVAAQHDIVKQRKKLERLYLDVMKGK